MLAPALRSQNVSEDTVTVIGNIDIFLITLMQEELGEVVKSEHERIDQENSTQGEAAASSAEKSSTDNSASSKGAENSPTSKSPEQKLWVFVVCMFADCTWIGQDTVILLKSFAA